MAERRDRDHRDLAVDGPCAEPAHGLEPVDAGQLEVHQHQVGRVLGGHQESFLARGRRHDVVPRRPEHVADELEVERVVLDHEDPRGRSWRPRIARLRGAPTPTRARAASRSSRLTGLSRYSAAPRASPGRARRRPRRRRSGCRRCPGPRAARAAPASRPAGETDVEHHGRGPQRLGESQRLDAVRGPLEAQAECPRGRQPSGPGTRGRRRRAAPSAAPIRRARTAPGRRPADGAGTAKPKVLPTPTSDSSQSRPPKSSMIRRVRVRPESRPFLARHASAALLEGLEDALTVLRRDHRPRCR